MCGKKPLSSVGGGGELTRLATGDVDPLITSRHRPGKATAPGEWKSRLRDSTRIDYAKSRSISKDAGAGEAEAAIHTAANVECDVEGNPLHIFKFVTDYIECHFTGELNIEAVMGDPIASHINECFVAEVGEQGALLADPRTYKEAIRMPDAKQWEEAKRTEIHQLERLEVFNATCPLPYRGEKKARPRS